MIDGLLNVSALILSALTPRAASVGNLNDERYWVPVGGTGGGFRSKTRAGVTVSQEVALTYEAVFAATRVLSEGIGCVPLPLYERVGMDRKPATLGVGSLLKLSVNDKMTGTVFRESRTAHQVNWGNGFAEIEFDRLMNPVALWPIHPSRVRASNLEDAEEFPYLITNDNGTRTKLRGSEMLHIPGALSDDAVWGRGVIEYGAESIGLGMATERSAMGFFGSGGQPKGVIEIAGMNDRQKRAAFREEWDEVHADPENNTPKIAIVNPGTKYTPISITNEASQLIETRKVNKQNIATLYCIPAYKIGAEGGDTQSTIEQKAVEFVVYSLLPWGKKQEDAYNFKLLSPSQRDRFYFEHNFAGLLRGDTKARYEAYRLAFGIGLMTINEMRRLENLPGIGPIGDAHFIPANMMTLERGIEGGNDPNAVGTGSDQNGQPADNPMDRNGQMTRALRGELMHEMKALEHELPERKAEWKAAATISLLDAFGRILTKESLAAKTAADKNVDFPEWLREYHGKQAETFTRTLAPACAVLSIAGVGEWSKPEELSAWMRERSREALISSYNSDSKTVFARKLDAWPTERAKVLAEQIVGAV